MGESNNLQPPREWAPLTYITQQIKKEVRIGFSTVKQSLTCIDFTDTHIAVGSDCSLIYWCPRSGLKPRELRTQEFGIPITAIRIGVLSKECNWIATGDKLGSIYVFQISTKHSSEDRVYHIPKHHKAAVTTLEWNDSGDTLFSGDEIGVVKTCELLFNKTSLVGNKQIVDEQYKIIQLSFKMPNLLLVSTLHQAVILKGVTSKDLSIQRIGKKARTSLIPLGGILTGPDSEPMVIVARPRQKLWIADINGDVLKTLIFTNLISEPCPEIGLINSAVNASNSQDLSTVEFNRIEKFTNNCLVISHHHGLLILDTVSISVVAALSGLRDLKNVAVNSDEIIFLEGNFNIVRLGWEPDPYQSLSSGKTADYKLPVGEALTDISTRLKHGALRFVPILTATFQGAMKSPDQVSEADEASELPPIVCLDGVAPLCVDRSSPTVRCVQSHEFENIALAQKRIRRKKSVKRNHRMKVSSGVDSGSDSISTTSAFSEFTSDSELSRQPSLTNMAMEDIPKDEHFSGELNIPADIKPDLRDLEAISADVLSKEKILEESLHLDDVILSFRKKGFSLNAENDNENALMTPEIDSTLSRLNQNSDNNLATLQTTNSLNSTEPFLNLLSTSPHTQKNSSPVSDSNQLDEENLLTLHEKSQEYGDTSAFGGLLHWNLVKVPESLKWFCVSEKFILIGGKKMTVYASDRGKKTCPWKKLDYPTSRMFMSPKGSLIWKLDVNIAYELRNNDLFSSEWDTVSRNVTSVSLNDFIAWYICDNQLYMQTALNIPSSTSSPAFHVPSQLRLAVVSCYKLFVWVLSVGNQVQRREGVSKDCLTGNFWVNVVTPDKIQVKNVMAGPNHSGWIISTYNDFYFTKDCSENVPGWFQLLLIDPIHLLRDPISHLINSTLWIAESDSRALYYCDSALEGEEWYQLCKGKWKLVSAGGIFVDYGSLWLYSNSGRLYQTYPHSCSVMQEISPPNNLDILCLAASSEVLWLLMTNGEIFIREGISSDCFAGKSWKPLDMQQISKKVIFQHLSIGLDSVWAVSKAGEVFVAVGSPFSMSTAVFAPAWVHVESEIVMAKVFLGPELHMVWAIDVHKNVYVRDAIFPDFQIGLSWVLVSGIKANYLSVSSIGVWAVSSDWEVFCRHGITQNNYIGDYWQRHTNSLSLISVSGDDRVWGLDRKNALVMRKTEFFSTDIGTELKNSDNPAEDLWEIIDRENSS